MAKKRLRTNAKMMRVQNTSGAITQELLEISLNMIAFWNRLPLSFNLSYWTLNLDHFCDFSVFIKRDRIEKIEKLKRGPRIWPRAPKNRYRPLKYLFCIFLQTEKHKRGIIFRFYSLGGLLDSPCCQFSKRAPKKWGFGVWGPKYQIHNSESGIYWKIM